MVESQENGVSFCICGAWFVATRDRESCHTTQYDCVGVFVVYDISSANARKVTKGGRVDFAGRVSSVNMPLQPLCSVEVFTANALILVCNVLGIIGSPCCRVSGGPTVV